MGTNGMSKHKFRVQFIVISAVSYVLIAILIVQCLVQFRTMYRDEEQVYINGVTKEIGEAVRSPQRSEKLQVLIDKYAIEIIVHDQNKEKVFASVYYEKDKPIKGIVNNNAKFLESSETIHVGDSTFYVWYTIYQVPFVKIIEGFLFKTNIIIIFIYITFLGLIIWFQISLLRPLNRVSKSLEMAENSSILDVDKEGKNDRLNARLTNFFMKQERVLNAVQRQNTKLEMELILEREHLENIIRFSRALVHDLKIPVYNSMVENELQLEEESNKERRNLLKSNIGASEKTLLEINEILKVLREDIYNLDKTVELFDSVEIIMSTRKHHTPAMKKKKLGFFLESEEKECIYQNKLGMQMLFHNIFSNMVYYSVAGSDIEVFIEKGKNGINIICYNESTKENVEKIRKNNQWTEVYEVEEPTGNRFSSGNGIYLIQELSFFLGGECHYTFEENTIKTTLFIPNKEAER